MSENIFIKSVNQHAGYLAYNAALIDVYDGNLSPYIIKDLKDQLSPQSFSQAIHRLSPINILPKFIDKLTNIYQTAVTREVIDGSEQDKKLLSWYETEMKINKKMNSSNSFFNMCKSSLIYPYVYDGKPSVRVIKNDRFVVLSLDRVDPSRPTHVVILAGKKNGKDIFWVYSDTEFTVYNSDGNVDAEEMARLGMEDGVNQYGVLPFVYANSSDYCTMPTQDTDLLRMTKIIPIMLTDLNLAAMFQSFSIMYGIDLDAENLKFAPNAFWFLKSDATSDKKPELGTLKPQVDFQEVLGLIQSQFSMWLGTKGIRASSIGNLTQDNFASGISKVIDEMDTYEARQGQTEVYSEVEKEFWDLVLSRLHPVWVETGMIENKALFTSTASVATKFAVQLPLQTRGQVVKDLKEEYASGFTTRKRALKKLNPEMTEQEIDGLEQEIDEERGVIQEEVIQDGVAED